MDNQLRPKGILMNPNKHPTRQQRKQVCRVALGVILSIACHSTMAAETVHLDVKVYEDGTLTQQASMSTLMGKEGVMQSGAEIAYDASVVVINDGDTGRKTEERVPGRVFDGIQLKITPIQAREPDVVLLTTDVRVARFKGFTPFTSAGTVIQRPSTTEFYTKQRVRVALGTTHVIEGTKGGESVRVELTPTISREQRADSFANPVESGEFRS